MKPLCPKEGASQLLSGAHSLPPSRSWGMIGGCLPPGPVLQVQCSLPFPGLAPMTVGIETGNRLTQERSVGEGPQALGQVCVQAWPGQCL